MFANLIFKADWKLKYYNIFIVSIIVLAVIYSPVFFVDRNVFLLSFFILNLISYYISKSKYDVERKLLLKSEKYEMIFNNSADAIFLLEVKENNFTYKRINKTHQKLTGLINEEIKRLKIKS